MKVAIFASYGNDSVALVQWMAEHIASRVFCVENVYVVFTDTGWAAQKWPTRVEQGERWVRSLGFTPVTIRSVGMAGLVEAKKAWPRGGGGKYQFCTEVLKEEPAREWLHEVDPDAEWVCAVGVRREESPNRALWPEWTHESPHHGGRDLWAPLVRHSEGERDALVARTPMSLLPHRSKECFPCANARQGELAAMDEWSIVRVERMERAGGVNSKGNPRVMFSPKRYGGAVGIRAVVNYCQGGMDDMFQPQGCDGGWCGS